MRQRGTILPDIIERCPLCMPLFSCAPEAGRNWLKGRYCLQWRACKSSCNQDGGSIAQMGGSGKPGSLRIDYCCPNQDYRDWGMGRIRGILNAEGHARSAESGGGKAVAFDFLVPVMYKCKWRAGRFVPPQSNQIEGYSRAVCQASRATVAQGYYAHQRRAAHSISHRRFFLP